MTVTPFGSRSTAPRRDDGFRPAARWTMVSRSIPSSRATAAAHTTFIK